MFDDCVHRDEHSRIVNHDKVREMLQIPMPPPQRWERCTQAAQRHGIPPRAFLDLVKSDPTVRARPLGKRGLLHIVASDADMLAQRLSTGSAA